MFLAISMVLPVLMFGPLLGKGGAARLQAVLTYAGVMVTAIKRRARFLAWRLDGLGNEPRPGVPRTITHAQVEEVVVRTLEV